MLSLSNGSFRKRSRAHADSLETEQQRRDREANARRADEAQRKRDDVAAARVSRNRERLLKLQVAGDPLPGQRPGDGEGTSLYARRRREGGAARS